MTIWSPPRPAVKTAISVLADAFGVYALVSAKKPRQRPIRFVVVNRVGGGLRDQATDVARLLIECYGPDVETVEAMTGTARAALRNAVSTIVDTNIWVRDWTNEHVIGDRPDPSIIDMERWQITGDFILSTMTLKATPGS